jgi:hypothetical protein
MRKHPPSVVLVVFLPRAESYGVVLTVLLPGTI